MDQTIQFRSSIMTTEWWGPLLLPWQGCKCQEGDRPAHSGGLAYGFQRGTDHHFSLNDVLTMQVGRDEMFSFISDMIEKMPTSIGADGPDGYLVVPDELPLQSGKRLKLCYELTEPSPMTLEDQLIKLICDGDDIACLDDLTSFATPFSLRRSESPSPPPPPYLFFS